LRVKSLKFKGKSRVESFNFQLNFEGRTSETSTKLNTQGLLMEGLRLLDESRRIAESSFPRRNANN